MGEQRRRWKGRADEERRRREDKKEGEIIRRGKEWTGIVVFAEAVEVDGQCGFQEAPDVSFILFWTT